ncbi:chromosome segregation protein [Corynebacterium kalinowskii]|uniref:Chromosome segregation protein n=1 Tax=Corynebacterium kalinowskii TaxID=2675216 RepID=A0A6B8VFF7_9CORY|nr:AAA family ATPase [Corynebacterium kalinowskii]QGU01759.1 chromosome segregation protein [Corynebacterium kalinowskii]
MQIHELSFSNVRGVTNFHLADLPERGVVVISGENEAGKSTMMEALWTVLFQKYSTNHKDVRAMQPAGRDVPMRICLTATVGPVRFRLVKQYLKSKKAELTVLAPHRATYTGGDAETQLDRILGEHLDRDLLETLFVRQGNVNAAFAAAGIPSLAHALDGSDASDTPKGPEDTGLIDAAAKEYDRYYTPSGKPKGELKQALSTFDSSETALVAVQSRKSELETDVLAFSRDEALLSEHTAKIPAARVEVADRKAALAAAIELAAKVSAAKNDLEHARTLAVAAEKALEQRNEQRSAVASAKAQLADLIQSRDPLAAEVEEHKASLAKAKEQLADAEERERSTRGLLNDARRDIDIHQRHARIVELRELLDSIEAKDNAISALRHDLPARVISAATVKQADDLSSAVAVAQAKVEALSAKLRLSAPDSTAVKINGETVAVGTDAQVRVLHSATTIVIGEVTAEFLPDGSNEEAVGELEACQSKLTQLLGDWEVREVEELRRLSADHARQEAEIAKLETERAALVGKKDLRELRRELEDLERALEGLIVPESDVAQLRSRESELKEGLSAREDSVRSCRVEVKSLEAADKQVELSMADTRIEIATTQLANLETELTRGEEEASTTELEEDVSSRRETVQKLEKSTTQLLESAAGIDVEEARDLLEGAESLLEGLKKSVADTELRMAERKGNIGRAEGVAEELLQAEAQHEAAEQQLIRVQRRADAAALLLITLRQHLDAARRRYSAPFVAKLSALSRSLFGADLDFILDDQLSISQRVIADTPIDLKALSGGAQEQLALLARCAVAELVDEGHGVPLFIDDALGNTDKQRLVMMNRVLTNLGKQRQVFVLTSMPERFERVVGKTALTMDELKRLRGIDPAD